MKATSMRVVVEINLSLECAVVAYYFSGNYARGGDGMETRKT